MQHTLIFQLFTEALYWTQIHNFYFYQGSCLANVSVCRLTKAWHTYLHLIRSYNTGSLLFPGEKPEYRRRNDSICKIIKTLNYWPYNIRLSQHKNLWHASQIKLSKFFSIALNYKVSKGFAGQIFMSSDLFDPNPYNRVYIWDFLNPQE